MLYLAFFLLLFVFGSCVDKKQLAEEQEELEFESDVVVGQEQDKGRLGEETIYETVDDNRTLRTLKNALRTADLDSVLSLAGLYTLFAPSDKAFEELVATGQNNLPDNIDQEGAKQILLNQIVEGNLRSTDLEPEPLLTILRGSELEVIQADNELRIGSADLVLIDREGDNGYVHIIDRVLMPN